MTATTTSPDVFEGTTNDFVSRWGGEYAEVSGFLKTLTRHGIAKKVREQKSATGKGKPSIVYSIPKTITLDMQKSETPAAPAETSEVAA